MESDAQIIKFLRDRIGYKKTQAQVAKELGVSASYLSEILSAHKKVGPSVLKRLGYDPTPHYKKVRTGVLDDK